MNRKVPMFLLALLALLAGVLVLVTVGAVSPMQAFGLVVLGQVALICLSRPQAALFLVTLTEEQVAEFQGIMREIKSAWGGMKDLPKSVKDLETKVAEMRRLQLSRRAAQGESSLRSGQYVSDECAEYLGALAVMFGEKRGALAEHPRRAELLARSQGLLGIEQRAALTSSDIPLPVGYGAEVVQLVNRFGDARRYGTIFPLGTGTVKLPRLKTDTTFGLIAQSATVTEKSPATEWVTFTTEKFGGLVRLPTEMSEDSFIMIGQFLAQYAARQIASVEDSNFFVGSGAGSGVNGSIAGLTYSTITNSKVVQMASTKTHYSDATLANVRTLRSVPDAAALRTSAYYMHPSFEQLLASFNTGGDRPYNPIAQLQGSGAQPFMVGPTLDGFPVRWVPIMPAYSTSANASKVFILFGDVSYQYLGVQGGPRFDTSLEAAFATDEILVRALERFTIGLMALGAVGGLETAAS